MTISRPTISFNEDLSQVPRISEGRESLRLALERSTTKHDVLHLLTQYVHFNAPFGAGVARLASDLAARPELFGDPSCDADDVLSDRSYDVAALVFAAAIEEFCGEIPRHPESHRELAKNVLHSVADFCGYSSSAQRYLFQPTASTVLARRRAEQMYGIGAPSTEGELFRSMGFHMGSERLAGDEFRLIDASLRRQHPDLVEHMERPDPAIGGIRAYTWIKIHTTVEDIHAEKAFWAANLALGWCRGVLTPPEVKECLVRGFTEFVALQADFMGHIGEK